MGEHVFRIIATFKFRAENYFDVLGVWEESEFDNVNYIP